MPDRKGRGHGQMDGNRDVGRSADAVSRVKRYVPQANVELVLSMQRPWRQDEKRDSRDWVGLEADEAALRAAGRPQS
jgi:hypothetical protein